MSARKRAVPHPAIVALRAEVAEIQAAGPTWSLLESDLKHDERAIARDGGAPFLWIGTPSATYMSRAGTHDECRADVVSKRWSHMHAVMLLDTILPDYPCARMRVWNGSTLLRCATRAELERCFASVVRARAIAHIREKITPLREELASGLCAPGSVWGDRLQRERTALESEIESAESWGP